MVHLKSLKYLGIHRGKDFLEIQNAWSMTEIIEIRWGEPENTAYKYVIYMAR